MKTNRSSGFIISLFIIFFLPVTDVFSEDWPMWRYDAGHTAASPGDLPEELNLLWARRYTPREMAWEDPLNQDLMPYDRVFEPVVLGKTMFLGFNDADKVVALDTDTGTEKWTVYVDGPVRLPPVAWNGKVYFSSDDGYLYCVDVKDGEILWKFRGGPSDRKILGNRRLISTWPARGGPVVKDGIVYFAASIWPFMGTFIHALDAETGRNVWTNDSNGSHYMLQPHNAPSFGGVAPQGVFTIAGDKLLVPGGRSVPACFDLNTGEYLYYQLASSGKTGGAFVCTLGDVFFNHHRERITTMYGLNAGEILVQNIGKYPVLSEESFYFSGESITACRAGEMKTGFSELRENTSNTRGLRRQISQKAIESVLWNIDVDASGDLIKAGRRLYAAGGKEITALNVRDNDTMPEIAWTKTVGGTVERLVAADDKLFAVTLEGDIMAFGIGETADIHPFTQAVAEPSTDALQKAIALLDQVGVKDGYALFYGIGDGDILEALITNSNLHFIAVDPDAGKVAQLRQRFDRNGLYGERVAVLEGDPETLEFPQYMASLTVFNDLDSAEYLQNKTVLNRIYNSMRPYGGVLWLPLTGEDRTKIAGLIANSGLYGAKTVESNNSLLLVREGPLPGAGEWTHNNGDIANTSKSDDSLVKLPLGILWFGGNSNLDVLPRHGHGPSEQVIGGRLFIEGMNCLSARDVYTGRVIWKTVLLDMGTDGVFYDDSYSDAPTSTIYNQVHIPGANIRGTNYVATLDRVYIIQGNYCAVLDSETGEQISAINLPPVDPKAREPYVPPWGYIGVYGDYLLAGYDFVPFSDLTQKKKAEYSVWEDFDTSASKALIVMDSFTGEILWRIDSNNGFLHNGIAVGDSSIYCLDKLPPAVEGHLRRRGRDVPDNYRLLALDIRTGELLWEKNENIFGSFLAYSDEHDVLIQSTRPSRDTVAGEQGRRIVTYNGTDGSIVWDKKIEYQTFPILHGDTIINESGIFNLMTGDSRYRNDPLTGEEIPVTWKRLYGCNYPIACENLVTFRSGAAGYFDYARNGGTGNFGGFKSGCTANLVAADGVLNAPDYTRTCSCAYQNQTSLALVHMPDVDIWTFNSLKWDGEPVKRVGINFGAPGDRLGDNGTLWLDYPSVGGESPDIPIVITAEKSEWYQRHSSQIQERGLNWVASSGVKGVSEIQITLAREQMQPTPYIVRLYFSEHENHTAGDRVFDIALQGKQVAESFDIASESGGQDGLIVKEFKNIIVEKELVLSFNPAGSSLNSVPIISGIEIIAEDSEL